MLMIVDHWVVEFLSNNLVGALILGAVVLFSLVLGKFMVVLLLGYGCYIVLRL